MHEAKKSGLRAETQPHSVGHNAELTCNVAQAAPSVINTTYHSLKLGHKLTTLCAPRRRSRRRPHSQVVPARPGGQDDPHTVASCPSLVSYHVNRCLGPVMSRRRRWRRYVLRGLDNNGRFETVVMGANARGCQVAHRSHQCRPPIANGCVLRGGETSRRSGLSRGKHSG
jgi:hypothetical protein